MEEVGPHEPALILREGWVRGKGRAHLIRTRLAGLEQIAMSPLEALQYICQLAGYSCGVQRQNPIDDVVGACLVGRVEIAWFGRRLEWTHDHPRGVGTQVERLPVQEGGL